MRRFAWSSCVLAAAFAVVGAAFGCGAEAKKDVAKTAVDAMSDEQRRETFEAMVRMLDEKPEHVDELYAVVKRHDRTMQRFLANSARDLREPRMSNMTARLLAQHPDSVEQMLVSSLDEIARVPPARAAMNRAMSRRAEVTVDILTDDPKALGRMTESALRVLDDKPAARKNVLSAARQRREQLLAFIESDPAFAKEMTEELIRASVDDKPWLDKTLRTLGVIDDDRAPSSKAKR